MMTACGDAPEGEDVLTVSVAPAGSSLTVAVDDRRPGKHTVWVVVRDAEGKRLQEFVAVNPGTEGSSSVRNETPLEPGTYTYSVYDVEGVHEGRLTALETPEHEYDAGEFEIR
jgi:hypothetical protein